MTICMLGLGVAPTGVPSPLLSISLSLRSRSLRANSTKWLGIDGVAVGLVWVWEAVIRGACACTTAAEGIRVPVGMELDVRVPWPGRHW